MSELKPGDRVWTRTELIQIHTSADGESAMRVYGYDWLPPSSVLPDSSNLAAVARVLSAHPGIGLSCDKIITYVSGVLDLMDSFVPEEKRLNDRMRKEVDALRALAAALNGNGE